MFVQQPFIEVNQPAQSGLGVPAKWCSLTSAASLHTLLPILKTQLPYFITYVEAVKAPINHDYIIIISSLTDRLIYSATLIFIRYVTTVCFEKQPENWKRA